MIYFARSMSDSLERDDNDDKNDESSTKTHPFHALIVEKNSNRVMD
jgi:hypothetical protein